MTSINSRAASKTSTYSFVDIESGLRYFTLAQAQVSRNTNSKGLSDGERQELLKQTIGTLLSWQFGPAALCSGSHTTNTNFSFIHPHMQPRGRYATSQPSPGNRTMLCLLFPASRTRQTAALAEKHPFGAITVQSPSTIT